MIVEASPPSICAESRSFSIYDAPSAVPTHSGELTPRSAVNSLLIMSFLEALRDIDSAVGYWMAAIVESWASRRSAL